MSILIKGMEMPKSCMKCKISFLDKYCSLYCPLVEDDVGPDGQVDNRCPLIPIPTPHGRLIDADELHSALRKRAKEFSNSEYGEGVKCGLADAREYIKIATTIIPAEEGKS